MGGGQDLGRGPGYSQVTGGEDRRWGGEAPTRQRECSPTQTLQVTKSN